MSDLLSTNSQLPSLLTEQLSTWRKRLHELDESVSKLSAERDAVRAKISAASTLLGRPMNSDYSEAGERALVDEITELMRDGVGRAPAHIRRDLIARGIDEERVSSRTGNFYNSLMRLTERGTLDRKGKAYIWKKGAA
jgi:hypothetical protein